MKICMIAQVEPSLEYGGGKAQYFLAEEWRKAGHEVQTYGFRSFKKMVCELRKQPPEHGQDLTEAFEYFLKNYGNDYDVIDYDFRTFPTAPPPLPKTLLVARSVLFKRSSHELGYPQSPRLQHRLMRGLRRIGRTLAKTQPDRRFALTLPNADLVNVTSKIDVASARAMGLPDSKICQFPYALSESTLRKMASVSASEPGSAPHFVFLGSFDFRKGCIDLAKAFHLIRQTYPDASLTILGAKGLHESESEVRYFFSKEDNSHVHIHMRFEPHKLVNLLTNKHAALFPSYNEGFPFAVQETLAAGLPTLAFHAAGAADILPEKWLSPCGDYSSLAIRAIELCKSYDPSLSLEAKTYIKDFVWSEIADATINLYQKKLLEKIS